MERVPQIDLRQERAPAHAERRREQALALRDACLGWLPLGGLLAWLADPLARWWLRRSGTPFLDEIAAIARTLGRPGVWLLHGAYAFGCTALADDGPAGPVCAAPSTGRFQAWAGWSRSPTNAARPAIS